MLRCYNRLCIYQRNGKCKRTYVEIGPMGACKGLDLVCVPSRLLEQMKKVAFEGEHDEIVIDDDEWPT